MLGFALLGILGVGLIFEAFDSDDNQSSNDNPQPDQPPVDVDPIEPPVDPGDQPELTTQTGTNGANDMDLTEGNDKAFGRGGEDLINGQGGEDSIFGGNASDTILGEKGDDFLRGSGSGDLVLGGEGNDVVRGDSGNDTLFGADLLSEQEIIAAYRAGEDPDLNLYPELEQGEADSLFGGVGDDFITAGANDIVDTGLGEDTVATGFWMGTGETATVTDFNTTEDVLLYRYDEAGAEPTITFAAGEDTLDAQMLVNGEPNVILKGVDHTTLDADNVVLAALEDAPQPVIDVVRTGTNGANDITLGDGNDRGFGRGGADLILGGAGEDTVFGGNDNDIVIGQAGDDFLRGGANNDLLLGSEGSDDLRGDSGSDTLFGANLVDEAEVIAAYRAGEDQDLTLSVAGENGEADTLFGGFGNDLITVGANDVADLGGGEDTLVSGFWMNAGETATVNDFDNDEDVLMYRYDDTGALPVISFAAGADAADAQMLVNGEATLTLKGVDHTTLSADSVILTPLNEDPEVEPPVVNIDISRTGTDNANVIELGKGNDRGFARGGDDLVLGDDGDDRVYGGDGDDVILGQKGDDFLRGLDDDDLILGGEGNDDIRGDTENDTLFGANLLDEEQVIAAYTAGETPSLTLTPSLETDEADTIFGGFGTDLIFAGANDVVETGQGSDTVVTGSWIAEGENATVLDFDPSQDVLEYHYEGATEPAITFGPGADATDAEMRVDGEAVLILKNVDPMQLDLTNVALTSLAPPPVAAPVT
jgi:Ca2+-binding RTX toxin-like protein